MQDIAAVLNITDRGCQWTDIYGTPKLEPMFVADVDTELTADLRCPGGDGGQLAIYPIAAVSDVTSWYFAMDVDMSQTTTPAVLVTSGISVATATDETGRTLLSVSLPVAAQTALITALGTAQNLTLNCEVGGMDANGVCVFVLQFGMMVKNRVYVPTT